MTDSPKTDATRVAIECLTLWLEPDRLAAAKRISDLMHEPDGPGAPIMVTGLLNLAQLLVLHVAALLGAPPDQYVAKANEILRHVAIDGMPSD